MFGFGGVSIPDYFILLADEAMEDLLSLSQTYPTVLTACTAAAGALIVSVPLAFLLRKRWRARASNDFPDERSLALSSIHFYSGTPPEENNNNKCIELLIRYPELVNKPISDDIEASHGYTPFLRACWNNNFELIQYMLSAGADVNIRNSEEETALYLVAYRVSKSTIWDPRALNLLWGAGCSVDDVNMHNNTMLHLAAKAGHATLTRWLLLHGADPDVQNRKGFTPHKLALKIGSEAHMLVASLLDHRQTPGIQRHAENLHDGIVIGIPYSISM